VSRSRGHTHPSLTAAASTGPASPGLALATLILVTAVANLTLSVANVALPSIGQYPQYTTQITAATKTAFLRGDQSAYIAVLLGAVLVFACFPKMEREKGFRTEYHTDDTEPPEADTPAPPPQPSTG
jgi:hypothetical protein